jgi:3-methyladenine DNA glycosylase/8-oxoguanine DNA glycosylase
MPLIRNIEDPRVVRQIDGLNRRNQFIREMARAILSQNASFESLSSIAHRVYDLHCSTRAGLLNRHPADRPERTALIA